MKDKTLAKFKKYEKFLNDNCFIAQENYCTSQLVSEIFGGLGSLDDKNKKLLTDTLPIWASFLNEKTIKSDLSLYVHIPYCFERCYYCYTHARKLENEKDLDIYTEKLIKYFHFFKPTFKKEVFDNLYIGGGTPSVLSEELLEKTLKEIFSCFNFTNKGEMTLENDPRNSSLGKLKIIKKYGITRVSFGIQTFNCDVLKINNRTHQSKKQVKKSVADARQVGFECINVDLIVGLYGESKKSILESLKEAIKLNPDTISIYTLQPMKGYLNKTYNINREDFFQKRKNLIEDILPKILKTGKDSGYFLPNAQFFNENTFKHLNDATCLKIVRKNFYYDVKTDYIANPIEKLNSILGIGEGSSTTITGKMRYKMEDPLTEDPNEYRVDATLCDIRREMIKNIIDNLSNTKNINLNAFKDRFNKDLLKEFDHPIKELEAVKIIERRENSLYFKCEDPKERFIYLLFFFNEKDVDNHANKNYSKNKETKNIQKEALSIDKNLTLKLKTLKKNINSTNTKIIEGVFKSAKNDKLIIQNEKGEEKELFFNKKTIFSESFLKEGSFKLVGKKEISANKIKINNPVVACIYSNNGSPKCLIVEKITVIN